MEQQDCATPSLFTQGLSQLTDIDTVSQTEKANLSSTLCRYLVQATDISAKLAELSTQTMSQDQLIVIALKILALGLPTPTDSIKFQSLLENLPAEWSQWKPTSHYNQMLLVAIRRVETKLK